MPHRDLLVSPDHAIYLTDPDVLVPARVPVKGVSIARDSSFRDVTYFHVELERLDILLAEALTAESRLDTGDRAIFDNAGAALPTHPYFAIAAGLRSR